MIEPRYPKAKIEAELKAGQNTGNHSLCSASRTRLAVCGGAPKEVRQSFLDEHGIGLECTASNGGLMLHEIVTSHSLTTVVRILKGAFNVAMIMIDDGQTALMIMNERPGPRPGGQAPIPIFKTLK